MGRHLLAVHLLALLSTLEMRAHGHGRNRHPGVTWNIWNGKMMDHWIGLRENLNRKPMGFYHEIWENLRLKFPLNQPSEWNIVISQQDMMGMMGQLIALLTSSSTWAAKMSGADK